MSLTKLKNDRDRDYAMLVDKLSSLPIMQQPIVVRYTFIVMVSLSNDDGFVLGTDVDLSKRIHVSLEDFEDSITYLTTRDKNPNSQLMVRLAGERGYKILNFKSYSAAKTTPARLDYMRDYMRLYRRKQKTTPTITEPELAETVNDQPLAPREPELTAELNGHKKPTRNKKEYSPEFLTWYEAYPKHCAKGFAQKSYPAAIEDIVRTASDRGITPESAAAWLLERTKLFATSDKGKSGQFCPGPAVWLNQKRYDDDPKTWVDTRHGARAIADPRGTFATGEQYLQSRGVGNGND